MATNIIQWGETKADVMRMTKAMADLEDIGRAARDADDYAEGQAEFEASLRTQADVLGITLTSDDIVTEFATILRDSRDHESKTAETIARSGGDKAQASAHRGRRGQLDSALDAIERGAAALAEIKAEQAR